MENFNLRKFLYNNTLITENQEMEEVSSKIKKSELKEKIRAEIMSTLSEEDNMNEEEGEDDLDAALDAAEDEVGDEAPADDAPADAGLEDEPAGPELSDEAGLSDEETDIQSNLKKAYDNAVSIGDEKLANQIANTITFFTRAHVVPRKD